MKQHRLHRVSCIAKRVVVVAALACYLVSPKGISQAEAQFFILSEEEFLNSERNRITDAGQVPLIPQNLTTDVTYAPLGGG